MIGRLILALLVGAVLLLCASFLHIISIVYLVGIVTGMSLVIAVVMWVRLGRKA